mgnify:CR=1 FL=1
MRLSSMHNSIIKMYNSDVHVTINLRKQEIVARQGNKAVPLSDALLSLIERTLHENKINRNIRHYRNATTAFIQYHNFCW